MSASIRNNRWWPWLALALALSALAPWLLRDGERVTAPAEPVADATGGRVAAPDDRHPAQGPVQAAPSRSAPEAGRLNQQAMNAWMTGDVRGAMALFEQAVAEAPDDPALHSNYGRLLTLMVSYERAIPLLERARDLSPQDAQVWLDLATAYERVQLLDESWAARAEAEELVGAGAITRDERGWLVVEGQSLW
jgi:tetratricopeptide (TPR) repeat protein